MQIPRKAGAGGSSTAGRQPARVISRMQSGIAPLPGIRRGSAPATCAAIGSHLDARVRRYMFTPWRPNGVAHAVINDRDAHCRVSRKRALEGAFVEGTVPAARGSGSSAIAQGPRERLNIVSH